MITTYEKFRIPDQGGKNDLIFEVNWNENDEDTNECKVLKISYPDGKKAYIKKEHLYSMLFAIGAKREQSKMIPQKITSVRHYKTTVYIQLRQDARKGDIIKVPVTITLPAVEEEIIGELAKSRVTQQKVEQKTKGGILIPEAVSNPSKITKEKHQKVEKASKQTID